MRRYHGTIIELLYKKLSLLIFFILFNILCSQQKEIIKVDSLLTISGQNLGRNNLKALEYAKQASLIAEQTNNSQRKAKSYTSVARILSDMAKADQSFEYLDKAANEKYTSTDIMLEVYIREIRCLNYTGLGLMQNVRDEYLKILQLLEKYDDNEAKTMKYRAYGNIASYYYETKKYSDAIRYIDLAERITKKIDTSVYLINERAGVFAVKGYVYLDTKKIDSAYKYFNKSYNILAKYNTTKYTQFMAFADYYFEQRKYKSALENYMKTLSDMEEHHMEDNECKIKAYKKISECFGFLKDEHNKQTFLNKYYKATEQTFNDNSAYMQAAVNNILHETKITKFKDEKKHGQHLYLIVSLCLIVLSVLTYFYLNKVKTRNKIIDYKEKELEAKKSIILEKESEALLLRKQLNESFEELVTLAKTNNSEFLARFQDVYPEFTGKLLNINPSLATSELQFCALLTFNFTSKEIAQFTYITPRTVENKKTRIRKRLNIPLDKNISIWLRELLD
ncbi:hypothetical protein AB1278_17570 [Chryseobacterium sp. NRRL B-14798]|uniref:tetratricopeptide repeat protein n=1 Tax=Chryseobacterium sp. NRRL B-14798 TaxID=3162880 RepID=UPI003D22AFB0